MDHPAIIEMEMTGFAPGESELEYRGDDFFGNEVYEGDEIYELDQEIFYVEELSADAKEILEFYGADKKTA